MHLLVTFLPAFFSITLFASEEDSFIDFSNDEYTTDIIANNNTIEEYYNYQPKGDDSYIEFSISHKDKSPLLKEPSKKRNVSKEKNPTQHKKSKTENHHDLINLLIYNYYKNQDYLSIINKLDNTSLKSYEKRFYIAFKANLEGDNASKILELIEESIKDKGILKKTLPKSLSWLLYKKASLTWQELGLSGKSRLLREVNEALKFKQWLSAPHLAWLLYKKIHLEVHTKTSSRHQLLINIEEALKLEAYLSKNNLAWLVFEKAFLCLHNEYLSATIKLDSINQALIYKDLLRKHDQNLLIKARISCICNIKDYCPKYKITQIENLLKTAILPRKDTAYFLAKRAIIAWDCKNIEFREKTRFFDEATAKEHNLDEKVKIPFLSYKKKFFDKKHQKPLTHPYKK